MLCIVNFIDPSLQGKYHINGFVPPNLKLSTSFDLVPIPNTTITKAQFYYLYLTIHLLIHELLSQPFSNVF